MALNQLELSLLENLHNAQAKVGVFGNDASLKDLPEELYNKQHLDLLIGYSGGIDSTVLLHLCWSLKRAGKLSQITAVHVNHGLQANAREWQQHCENECRNYQIPLLTKTYELAEQGESSELAARNVRYKYFESCIKPNQFLLLAHHQDDQAETLLFRLIRGTGIHGMSAMSPTRALGEGYLHRPLLTQPKAVIQQYAQEKQLCWIEDPSNLTDQYARNFLRNRVLPMIQKRWPKASNTLTQFSNIASQQVEILNEVAFQDFQSTKTEKGHLILSLLFSLSKARQNNLIHFWVKRLSQSSPSSGEISELFKQLNDEKKESVASSLLKVKLGPGFCRSYLGELIYFTSEHPPMMNERQLWQNIKRNLKLSSGIVITSQAKNAAPSPIFVDSKTFLRMPKDDEVVTVRPRVGGETAKPSYRNKSTSLKNIYQELKIPPWEREWLPLVYYNDTLAAVPGVFVDQQVVDETGIELALRLDA